MYILVIEDNPDLVANLYDYLEARGHVPDVSYDGRSGIEFANRNSYDVIVLDLMLPDMDGMEVCTRLRESGHDLPILILTARDTLQDKLDGFECGADDYLVKPFALQELEVRLLSLIRRGSSTSTRKLLRIGDLEFNPVTLDLKRAGNSIELPPTPLKILEFLMRLSPRVVSREKIERHVWGDNPPRSDALRAHLHMLRISIDKPYEHKLLHTIRGQGYQLTESDDA